MTPLANLTKRPRRSGQIPRGLVTRTKVQVDQDDVSH